MRLQKSQNPRNYFQFFLSLVTITGCLFNQQNPYATAEALFASQNYISAANEYERLFNEIPSGITGWIALYRSAQLQSIFLKQEKQALIKFQDIVRLCPYDQVKLAALHQGADILFVQSEDYAKACNWYEQLSSLIENISQVHSYSWLEKLGIKQHKNKGHSAIINQLKLFYWYRMARCYFLKNQWIKAQTIQKQIISFHPTEPLSFYPGAKGKNANDPFLKFVKQFDLTVVPENFVQKAHFDYAYSFLLAADQLPQIKAAQFAKNSEPQKSLTIEPEVLCSSKRHCLLKCVEYFDQFFALFPGIDPSSNSSESRQQGVLNNSQIKEVSDQLWAMGKFYQATALEDLEQSTQAIAIFETLTSNPHVGSLATQKLKAFFLRSQQRKT